MSGLQRSEKYVARKNKSSFIFNIVTVMSTCFRIKSLTECIYNPKRQVKQRLLFDCQFNWLPWFRPVIFVVEESESTSDKQWYHITEPG